MNCILNFPLLHFAFGSIADRYFHLMNCTFDFALQRLNVDQCFIPSDFRHCIIWFFMWLWCSANCSSVLPGAMPRLQFLSQRAYRSVLMAAQYAMPIAVWLLQLALCDLKMQCTWLWWMQFGSWWWEVFFSGDKSFFLVLRSATFCESWRLLWTITLPHFIPYQQFLGTISQTTHYLKYLLLGKFLKLIFEISKCIHITTDVSDNVLKSD